MESPIKQIVLSQTAKDQLIRLKRPTKIQNWNVFCRWAFVLSLNESTPPTPVPVPADSNVEMTWKVFGGEYADIYLLALKQRMYNDKLPINEDSIQKQFRLHLHRGIGCLASERIKNIKDLLDISLKE